MTNNEQQHGQDDPVEIVLDDNPVIAPRRRLNGRKIRELGPVDRVDGFETQRVNKQGKKEQTIRDDQEVELHKDERFRTVPNEGGPGDCT